MDDKAKHAGVQSWGDGSRLVVAALIPLVALAVQWIFWADIQPYVWFLFFPAVFFSSWVGGLRGGLLATAQSTLLVWYCFIPPRFTFALERPMVLVSVVVFVGMGILFSVFHERLRKAKQLTLAEESLRASEQRLRFVTENAHVGLVVVNREHCYSYANAAYCQVLGLKTTDIIGLRVAEVLGELYEQQVKPRLDRAFGGERVTFELLKPLNGVNRFYAVTYEPHNVVGGQSETVVVVIFDITERKQVEASVAEAARLAQSTIDALTAHICLLDETGKILATNEAWRRFARENRPANLLAATRDDNYLQVCDAVVGPEAAAAAAFAVGIRALMAGTAAEFAMEYPCHSPTEQRWFIGRVTRFAGSGPLRVVVAHENITVRKRTEAAALRLAAIVGFSDDAIIGKNLAGVVTSWNSGAEKVFGFTADEMVGGSIARLIPPDRQGEEEMILSRMKRGESVQHFETVRLKKNGGLIDVSVTVSPIKDNAGAIIGASKVARDITARKQTEAALRKSEAQLNFALQTSGIGAWDLNLTDHTANRTLIHEQIFGYEKLQSQWSYEKFLEHVLPEDRAEVDRRFQVAQKTQSDWKFECRIRRADGEVRWIFAASGHHKDAQGKSVRLSGIVQDITERHNAEAKLRESEEKFSRLFDSNPAATSVTTIKDGRYLNVNVAWLKKFQWTRDEVIGHTVHELGIWPDLAKREALFAKLKEQGWVHNYEIQLRTKSGQLKQFIWSGVRLTLNGEECLLGTAMDITKQKAAMAALQESQLLYYSLVTQLPIGIFQKDEAGRYVYVNPAFCKIKGIDSENFVGRTPKEVDADESALPEADGTASKYAADGEDHHRQIMQAGKAFEVDEEYTLVDGRKQFVHVMKLPVLGAGGKVVGSQGIMLDITERMLADDQLRQSEERYKGLFERSLDCVFLSDFEGRFLDANPAALNLLGYEPKDIASLTFASLITPDQFPLALQATEEIRTTGFQKTPTEFRLRRKDGRQVLVETQSSLIYRDGKPFAIQGIARNITARRQAEESLARLATAVEQSAETIVITDTKGIILYANPAFEKTSGYTRAEALGRSTRLLKSGKQDDEFYRRMWSVLEVGEIWSGHFINRHKSGTYYEEEATISPVRDTAGKMVNYVAVKRDLTREMQLEAQFRQSQKMEAIGQLAGGVAHDFNNILAVIQLQAGLLKTEPNLTEKHLEYAADIEKAAQRAADLTRQLLLFSRKQAMLLRDIDLNETITSIAKMLQRVLRENIQMHFKLASQSLMIHADASMMDQVLMNLTVNARDAMPDGGELHIETSFREFDEATAALTPPARAGGFACVTVTDAGCGIAPENMPRIFEPFFTTKEIGKGTGLGLATVFGIVQQHQGWIEVSSEPGKGTTFRIYLPLLKSPTHKPAEWSSLTPTYGGNEATILLVEDDSLLRASTRITLQRLGYRVLEAADGAAAVAIWKSKRNEIWLLLTDLVMPGGLNGKTLAEQLRRDEPKLKVIYVSGYSADIASKDFQLEEGVNFLAKPFEIGKLAQIVGKCLDQV